MNYTKCTLRLEWSGSFRELFFKQTISVTETPVFCVLSIEQVVVPYGMFVRTFL